MDGGITPRRSAASRRGDWDSAPGFGAALRGIREDHKFSQRQLAGRVGLSASYLSLLETAQRRPTREQIVSIALALGLDSAEEQNLLKAAGFGTDDIDIDTAIARIVDNMAEQTTIDRLGASLVLHDLTSLVDGWLRAFQGTRHLHGGQFSEAERYYGDLITNTQFSPALMTYLQNRYTDALLRNGKLTEATRIAQRMRKQVDDLQVQWAVGLKAEIIATQAMLALREGNYDRAHNLLNTSREEYSKLLSQPDPDESVVNQGYGRSYKRLAQLALFEGNVGSALNSCLAAEAYLLQSAATWTRDLWLRRTHELKGWAYSKLGTRADIQRAIDIHTKTRQECEESGDTYGAIMGWLYIADDLRHDLQLAIAQDAQKDGLPPDLAPPDERRSLLRKSLDETEVKRADDCYQQALREIARVDDQLMVGRCRSSHATIQRYSGSFATTRADAERIYRQAHDNLAKALEIDTRIGQRRRLPTIYLSMANVAWDLAEWDSSQLLSARSYVDDGLRALESPTISADDASARSIRERLERARVALNEQIEQFDVSSAGERAVAAPSVTARRWSEECDNLLDLLSAYIERNDCAPLPGTDKDEEWLETILGVEVMPGQRILAQNRLSVSLSLCLPGGARADSADLYSRRHTVFQRNVRAASASNRRATQERELIGDADAWLPQLNRDLCCRRTVDQSLQEAASIEATRAGLTLARDLMKETYPGYELSSSARPLPVAYMVKGSRVLIEVPDTHADRFSPDRASLLFPGQAICYSIDDADLAHKLTTTFDRLTRLAGETLEERHEQPDTIEWLHWLLIRDETRPKPVPAGSI